MEFVMRQWIKHLALKTFALFCRDDGPKVVYYHDVGKNYTCMGTPFELFKSHVECAKKNGFSFIRTLADLKEKKQLQICFDDGFRGIWDYQQYFLIEEIFPTIFIPVDLIGRLGYLTWAEVLELQGLGFHFEGHTWSHRPLTDVPENEWQHELRDSKCYLEDKLGKEISCLCFPCGFFSDDVISAAREAGYRYLVASYPGCVKEDDMLIPRHLVQSFSVKDYGLVLQGALGPLRSRYIRQHKKS